MSRRPEQTIVVEQLNRAQWHAHIPGYGATGVGNYVETLADALNWAAIDGYAVETLDLDHERRLLCRAPMTRLLVEGRP
jgi:hypothetical protein